MDADANRWLLSQAGAGWPCYPANSAISVCYDDKLSVSAAPTGSSLCWLRPSQTDLSACGTTVASTCAVCHPACIDATSSASHTRLLKPTAPAAAAVAVNTGVAEDHGKQIRDTGQETVDYNDSLKFHLHTCTYFA